MTCHHIDGHLLGFLFRGNEGGGRREQLLDPDVGGGLGPGGAAVLSGGDRTRL